MPHGALRDEFGEMQRGVGLVPDASQQHMSVELMHSPHRTVRNLRRQRQQRLHGRLGVRPDCGEGLQMIGAHDTRLPPEKIGRHAQREQLAGDLIPAERRHAAVYLGPSSPPALSPAMPAGS